MEMPTSVQVVRPQPTRVMRNLIKRRALGNARLYLKHGRGGDWPSHARKLLDHAIASGGVFHLWGHSWELEAQDQWGPLDALLGHLATFGDRAELATNGGCVKQFRCSAAAG